MVQDQVIYSFGEVEIQAPPIKLGTRGRRVIRKPDEILEGHARNSFETVLAVCTMAQENLGLASETLLLRMVSPNGQGLVSGAGLLRTKGGIDYIFGISQRGEPYALPLSDSHRPLLLASRLLTQQDPLIFERRGDIRVVDLTLAIGMPFERFGNYVDLAFSEESSLRYQH